MLIVNPRCHIFHYPNQMHHVETRKDRKRLPYRDGPYWWHLAHGRHLGYRPNKNGGTWGARIRLLEGRYEVTRFGKADDVVDADGETVLNFSQAVAAAETWFATFDAVAIDPVAPSEKRLEIPRPEGAAYTVAHAITDYLEWYAQNRRDVRKNLYTARAFILPELGHIPLTDVTTEQISRWFDGLSHAPARVRSGRGRPVRHKRSPRSPEELRRRRNSANWVLTLLKSALTKAFYDGHIDTDLAWQRVRKHRNVDKPRTRFLSGEECRRLLRACDPDLRALIRGALLTGCRAGELTRMAVGDYVPATGKIFIEKTKSGRPRAATLTAEGQVHFDSLVRGRGADEPMFVRSDGRPWGKDHYDRQLKEACKRAGIRPPISFHILRHTYASHAAMAGIQLIVIAKQLGHADTRMVEKHYAHLAQSFIDQQIRAMMPPLGS